MLARKAAAALAAGCTAVAVPSMLTPFSALALAALGEEAGLPPGSFSVLTGNPAVLGGELVATKWCGAFPSPGQREVGQLLMAQCAPSIKRLSLELGGHAPFIVFADFDVEPAAKAAAEATYQRPDRIAWRRIAYSYIGIFIPVLSTPSYVKPNLFALATVLIRVSRWDRSINRQTLAKSETHVADAVSKGARLLTGGRRSPQGELFYEPTVLPTSRPT